MAKSNLQAKITGMSIFIAKLERERDRYRKALLDIKSRVLVIDAGQGTVSTMLQYIRDDINKALRGEDETAAS